MIRLGIVGATGYTGVELFKITSRHPEAEVVFVASSEETSGNLLSEVYPGVKGSIEMELLSLEDALRRDVDVVFLCLPAGKSMSAAPSFLDSGVKVVDIGTDFRMRTPEGHLRWYDFDHTAPHLLPKTIWGLPEINREAIRGASLVSNPGCYPTAALLALAPLLERDLICTEGIIIDSKSGISGAGRKLSLRTHFIEVNENVAPYNIGRSHRHTGEIEQELSKIAGKECKVVFTPQTVPMDRGILSNVYVRLKEDISTQDATQIYKERYADEPFIRIAEDYLPQTKFTSYTNYCDITVHKVEETHVLLIISALDNLIKGAAGQAVQNMNIMFDTEETLGLFESSPLAASEVPG